MMLPPRWTKVLATAEYGGDGDGDGKDPMSLLAFHEDNDVDDNDEDDNDEDDDDEDEDDEDEDGGT
jgi:alkaline phosphatase D